jgi:hypothetical protein
VRAQIVGMLLPWVCYWPSTSLRGNMVYFDIPMPGGMLGLIAGYASQRYERAPQPQST